MRTAIAGVQADDLDIAVTPDTLTIRGQRHSDHRSRRHHHVHVQECHWGAFSRSIVLPTTILPEHVRASLKRGILTITLPKTEMSARVSVLELEE